MQKDRKLNRLKNYDYSQPGYYYITICVHPDLRWKNIFGKIQNGKMVLNEYGGIIKHVWQNLPNHYNNCLLDEYIIMPNHNGIFIDFRNWWCYSLCSKELKV